MSIASYKDSEGEWYFPFNTFQDAAGVSHLLDAYFTDYNGDTFLIFDIRYVSYVMPPEQVFIAAADPRVFTAEDNRNFVV